MPTRPPPTTIRQIKTGLVVQPLHNALLEDLELVVDPNYTLGLCDDPL